KYFAVDVLHAEDGIQSIGIRGNTTIGVETEYAPLLKVGLGCADIHRILSDEDPPVRRAADDRGVAQLWRTQHNIQSPAGWTARQFGFGGRLRVWRGRQDCIRHQERCGDKKRLCASREQCHAFEPPSSLACS